jgi:cephalosporin hydroxylase
MFMELQGAATEHRVDLERLVDEAFAVGMVQVREEALELSRLIQELQPRNFLEIGTDRGGTFYLFCQLTEREGKKISVDLPGGAYGSIEHNFAVERDRKMRAWSEQVTILERNSHDPRSVREVEEILSGELCDFLFIDGDHSYNGACKDFRLYRHLVRAGGYVIFHDIADSEHHRQQNCFVSRLWREVHGDKREIIAGREWGGIGVLRVPRRKFRRSWHILRLHFKSKFKRRA